MEREKPERNWGIRKRSREEPDSEPEAERTEEIVEVPYTVTRRVRGEDEKYKDVEEIVTERVQIVRRLVEIAGQNIWLIEATPEKELNDEVPVIVAPGFQQSGESFLAYIMQLAARGRHVVSFTARHGIDPEGYREELIEERGFPENEYRKAASIIGVANEIGCEQFDLVGPSDAALYGGMSATAFPERFRNIILFNPVLGPVEDVARAMLARETRERVARHRRRYLPDPKDERKRRVLGPDRYDWDESDPKLVRGDRAEEEPPFRNPVTWKQLISMAEGRKHDLLADLEAQGINIVVVYGTDDKVLLHDTYKGLFKRLQEAKEKNEMPLHGVVSVKGGHDLLHQYPSLLAGFTDDALTKLERAREKRKGENRQNTDLSSVGA